MADLIAGTPLRRVVLQLAKRGPFCVDSKGKCRTPNLP